MAEESDVEREGGNDMEGAGGRVASVTRLASQSRRYRETVPRAACFSGVETGCRGVETGCLNSS